LLPQYLLGKTFDCDCGRTHTVSLQALIYSPNALDRLPKLLTHAVPARSQLRIVADTRTYDAAGYRVEKVLKDNWDTQTTIIRDGPDNTPVCDDHTRDRLVETIGDSWDVMIAVGSGVVNDLCKWIAFQQGKPYLTVATAASMNGYASVNVAPSIDGVKKIVNGCVPFAILAMPDVIEDAPFELTAAGLGDVIAKPVSTTDWKINNVLFDEYFCPLCCRLIEDIEPLYMSSPRKIRSLDPETIRGLFSALVYSGISMTMAGSSSPASGGEHLISHTLDMKGKSENSPLQLHGSQVGVATIFVCALYERLLQMESPQFREVVEETDSAYWKSLTDAVEAQHALKRRKVAHATDRLRDGSTWDAARETIASSIPRAYDIKQCLSEAGAAHSLDHINVSKADFLNAVMHSHQVRERYTVIDLARAAGILPGAANDIVNEYLGG